MANATMTKFGYPETLVHEYRHWAVLLRPSQVTLGSLILAAKSDATAFGQLPQEAHAELSIVTAALEAALSAAFRYDRINYLMLMMVDPHVHFHVIPRYASPQLFEGITMADSGWPGPPDLASGQLMPDIQFRQLQAQIIENWV